MPWSKEMLEEIYPEPDGFVLVHHRRPNGNDCYWGPFATMKELDDWAKAQEGQDLSGSIIPLYKSVDWRR